VTSVVSAMVEDGLIAGGDRGCPQSGAHLSLSPAAYPGKYPGLELCDRMSVFLPEELFRGIP